MYIHLDKDGKINDICSRLDGGHKYSEDFKDEDYIQTNEKDLKIEDTWDLKNQTLLKYAPSRFIEAPKSELELLKEEIENLKTRIKKLESKSTKK